MASYNDVFGNDGSPSWLTAAKEDEYSNSAGTYSEFFGLALICGIGLIGSNGVLSWHVDYWNTGAHEGASAYSLPSGHSKQSDWLPHRCHPACTQMWYFNSISACTSDLNFECAATITSMFGSLKMETEWRSGINSALSEMSTRSYEENQASKRFFHNSSGAPPTETRQEFPQVNLRRRTVFFEYEIRRQLRDLSNFTFFKMLRPHRITAASIVQSWTMDAWGEFEQLDRCTATSLS